MINASIAGRMLFFLGWMQQLKGNLHACAVKEDGTDEEALPDALARAKALQLCYQEIAESARFGAWHTVRDS